MSESTAIPTVEELAQILRKADGAMVQVYVNDELAIVHDDGYDPHHDEVYISGDNWSHVISAVKAVESNGYICTTDTSDSVRVSFKLVPPDMALTDLATIING